MIRVNVLTVSDRASAGDYADETGPAVAAAVAAWEGFVCEEVVVVSDDLEGIVQRLRQWSDDASCDVILTNGGTGIGPRDQTPEATKAVLEREIPGIPELMRQRGFAATPLAALSRATAGYRNHTVIVNLPGSPKGAIESLEVLPQVLRHAVKVVTGGSH